MKSQHAKITQHLLHPSLTFETLNICMFVWLYPDNHHLLHQNKTEYNTPLSFKGQQIFSQHSKNI